MMTAKDIISVKPRLVKGHGACAGCAEPIIAKIVLSALKDDFDVVIANATSCLEVVTSIYPMSAWNVPWIHNAFENAAATISGVETAYRALLTQKKIKPKKPVKFLAFGGDGGTYDIGLQSLSGAMERGHDFVYVCYDNEGYMNTGNQRSSATPYGAATTTTPAGSYHPGKEQWRKDIVKIAEAHNVKYVAQAAVHNFSDLAEKARKAFEIEGPAFIVVLSPCTSLWGFPVDKAIEVSRKAVDTCFWPLYEIENGVYKINYKPNKKPITEFIETQKRFKHLFIAENKHIIKKIQDHIDFEWQKLLAMEKLTQEFRKDVP
jgi:pyruvate ferredoxin oxidoreductase beta subunit